MEAFEPYLTSEDRLFPPSCTWKDPLEDIKDGELVTFDFLSLYDAIPYQLSPGIGLLERAQCARNTYTGFPVTAGKFPLMSHEELSRYDLAIPNEIMLQDKWNEMRDKQTNGKLGTFSFDDHAGRIVLTGYCGLTKENFDEIEKHSKVNYLINVTNDLPMLNDDREDSKIKTIRIPVEDNAFQERLFPFFDEVTDLIDSAMKKNQTVIVCSWNGNSRAATIVMAYLIKYGNCTLKDAFESVLKKRPNVRPALAFLEELGEFANRHPATEKQATGWRKSSRNSVYRLPRFIMIRSAGSDVNEQDFQKRLEDYKADAETRRKSAQEVKKPIFITLSPEDPNRAQVSERYRNYKPDIEWTEYTLKLNRMERKEWKKMSKFVSDPKAEWLPSENYHLENLPYSSMISRHKQTHPFDEAKIHSMLRDDNPLLLEHAQLVSHTKLGNWVTTKVFELMSRKEWREFELYDMSESRYSTWNYEKQKLKQNEDKCTTRMTIVEDVPEVGLTCLAGLHEENFNQLEKLSVPRGASAKGSRMVKYVINVSHDAPMVHCTAETYRIPIEDKKFDQKLTPYFKPIFNLIQKAKVDGDCAVIHCYHGMSRSVTIMLSYLMKSQNWSLERAFRKLSENRIKVKPSLNFLQELRALEKTMFDPELTAWIQYNDWRFLSHPVELPKFIQFEKNFHDTLDALSRDNYRMVKGKWPSWPKAPSKAGKRKS